MKLSERAALRTRCELLTPFVKSSSVRTTEETFPVCLLSGYVYCCISLSFSRLKNDILLLAIFAKSFVLAK